MSIGFTKDFDTSHFNEQEFVRAWGSISSLGKDFVKEMKSNIGTDIVLREGISNNSVIYAKASLFLLGYSQVNDGDSENYFDKYTGDAVEKFKKLYSDEFETIDVNRNIDSEFFNALSNVFSMTDSNAVTMLKKELDSRNPVNQQDQGYKGDSGDLEKIGKNDSTALQKMISTGVIAHPDFQQTRIVLPKPSGKYEEELVYGDNYPAKDEYFYYAKQSVIYSYTYDGETQVSPNFKVKEFRCPITDIILINPFLVEILERLRTTFNGRSVNILSGYRSPKYNEIIRRDSIRKDANKKGNVAINSQHKFGNAADILIDGVKPSAVFKFLNPWWQGGLGKYPGFTHVDVRNELGSGRSRW
jgi:hypothetical protein